MAKVYAQVAALFNPPVGFGQPLANRLSVNRANGRIRFFEYQYIAPPSGMPAIADVIVWGKLPAKSLVVGHASRLSWSTGAASCTLTLGDNTLAARHLAATSVTTAGSATPEAANLSSTGTANTVTGSATVSNVIGIGAFRIGDIVTGTGIPAATYVFSIDYTARAVILTQNATATGTAVVLTSAGSGYETQDDSNSIANNYGSLTDDCTLTSTVAGAAVAANQAFVLKMAYVND